MLLVQLLVLVFTGALWWIARRDLAARVPPPVPPALPDQDAGMAELEQLCATLETLVTSLARRLDRVEAALSQTGREETASNQAAPGEAAQTRFPVLSPAALGPAAAAVPERQPEERPAEPDPRDLPDPQHLPDPRYVQVYALLDSGVSDPVEVARQTGLGRGEVELILSLRGRRAL